MTNHEVTEHIRAGLARLEKYAERHGFRILHVRADIADGDGYVIVPKEVHVTATDLGNTIPEGETEFGINTPHINLEFVSFMGKQYLSGLDTLSAPQEVVDTMTHSK